MAGRNGFADGRRRHGSYAPLVKQLAAAVDGDDAAVILGPRKNPLQRLIAALMFR
jgi:hypothetical protein